MTAKDVQKIRENVGVPWNDQTFRDIFKAGNPDVQVKGIATTCMALSIRFSAPTPPVST